jgi:hypothetical protein
MFGYHSKPSDGSGRLPCAILLVACVAQLVGCRPDGTQKHSEAELKARIADEFLKEAHYDISGPDRFALFDYLPKQFPRPEINSFPIVRCEAVELGSLDPISVRRLWVSGQKLGGNEMKQIAAVSKLLELSISPSRLEPGAICKISPLHDLKRLRINRCVVRPDDFHCIAEFPALEGLTLFEAQITDEGIEQLASSKTLASLDLQGTQTTGRALTSLGRLPNLKEVVLGDSVADEDLKQLRGPELRDISMPWSKVTHSGLGNLSA